MKVQLSHKYLGTSLSGGASRCDQVLAERFRKVKNRKRRNALFAKRFRGAGELFSGSTLPAMIWGHPVSGLTAYQMLEAEKTGARCLGIHAAGKCRFVTNIIIYGQYGHPVARIIKETFRTWCGELAEVFAVAPLFYASVRAAWN